MEGSAFREPLKAETPEGPDLGRKQKIESLQGPPPHKEDPYIYIYYILHSIIYKIYLYNIYIYIYIYIYRKYIYI